MNDGVDTVPFVMNPRGCFLQSQACRLVTGLRVVQVMLEP